MRDGNIDITNVQMEIGTEDTTFERLSYAEQQTLCQRYCQVWSEGGDALIFAGNGQGTTAIDFGWPLAVPRGDVPHTGAWGRLGVGLSPAPGECRVLPGRLLWRCGQT